MIGVQNIVDGRADRRFDRLEFGERQLGEHAALHLGSFDDHAGRVMGAAERQTGDPDEPVGEVGRCAEPSLCGGPQALAVGPHIAHHPGSRREAELQRVGGLEDRDLVFLQILAVGERQALHHRQQCN